MSDVNEATTEHGDEHSDFESAMERLETIVRALERGEMGLNDSLAHYEEGVACLRRCERALSSAEGRIEQLFRIDSEGNAVVEPFEHQQSAGRPKHKKTEPTEEPPPTDPPNSSGDLF